MDTVKARDVAVWLQESVADAERRGLPELKPMLEGLAQATTLLRSADWNDDASGGSVSATAAKESK